VSRTRGSRYPRVFPRVYSRVPVEDPDSCPALFLIYHIRYRLPIPWATARLPLGTTSNTAPRHCLTLSENPISRLPARAFPKWQNGLAPANPYWGVTATAPYLWPFHLTHNVSDIIPRVSLQPFPAYPPAPSQIGKMAWHPPIHIGLLLPLPRTSGPSTLTHNVSDIIQKVSL